MKQSRFDGLSGVMRGQSDTPAMQAKESMSPKPGDEDEPVAEGDEDEEDPDMKDPEDKGVKALASAPTATPPAPKADAGDVVASVRAEERQRIADVFASEHVKGREAAAVALLTDSDMPANKIVGMLPTLTQSASSDDGDKMLAQMREGAGADTGIDGGDLVAEENHGWGKIHEELRKDRGL